ncbi:P1 family peptidase [Xanthovirga aplysinae]|uniref:P1 family peptidase n=1 Tax=Xanthovirga aplysinae TaxID=2529853 RepID=UPI0031B5E0A7
MAFSTHLGVRIPYSSKDMERVSTEVSNDHISPLFLAVLEATEEAIYNSLFMATDMRGQKGRVMKALPIQKTLKILDKYSARKK